MESSFTTIRRKQKSWWKKQEVFHMRQTETAGSKESDFKKNNCQTDKRRLSCCESASAKWQQNAAWRRTKTTCSTSRAPLLLRIKIPSGLKSRCRCFLQPPHEVSPNCHQQTGELPRKQMRFNGLKELYVSVFMHSAACLFPQFVNDTDEIKHHVVFVCQRAFLCFTHHHRGRRLLLNCCTVNHAAVNMTVFCLFSGAYWPEQDQLWNSN